MRWRWVPTIVFLLTWAGAVVLAQGVISQRTVVSTLAPVLPCRQADVFIRVSTTIGVYSCWGGAWVLTGSTTAAVWGAITGTLSTQTDLQTALNAKAATNQALDTFGPTTDILTLNTSLTAHGLVPKLPGGTTTFFRADGTWATPSAGTVAWGAITGTLSAQTDLQTALDARAVLAAVTNTFTGSATFGGTLGVAGALTAGLAGTGTGTITLDGTAANSPAIIFNQNGTARGRVSYQNTGGRLFLGDPTLAFGMTINTSSGLVAALNSLMAIGNFSVGPTGTAFSVAAATGNTLVGGTLTTGAIATTSTVTAAGDVISTGGSLGGINGNFSGTFNADGVSSFGATVIAAGLANLNGGIAVDTSNFTVSGTTGAIATAALASLTTPSESWVGPSTTTGVYFKSSNVGIGTTGPTAPLQVGTTTGIANRDLVFISGTVTPSAFGSQVSVRTGTINAAVNNNAAVVYVDGTIAIAASGTHSNFAGLRLGTLQLTATGGTGVVTTAATLQIDSAPTGATNNYALNIAAGNALFGGALTAAGSVTTLNTGFSANTSGTVVSSFGNGLSIGTWDAIGWSSAGSADKLAVGGYRASQWTGVDLYVSNAIALSVAATRVTVPANSVLKLTCVTLASLPAGNDGDIACISNSAVVGWNAVITAGAPGVSVIARYNAAAGNWRVMGA